MLCWIHQNDVSKLIVLTLIIFFFFYPFFFQVVLQTLFRLSNATKPLFPATVGVTLDDRNISYVHREKSFLFGIAPPASRVLVLCFNLNVYLIDSKLHVFHATKYFPKHFASEQTNLTLLDGELSEDAEGNLRLLVLDVIACHGMTVRSLVLHRRLDIFSKLFSKMITAFPEGYPALQVEQQQQQQQEKKEEEKKEEEKKEEEKKEEEKKEDLSNNNNDNNNNNNNNNNKNNVSKDSSLISVFIQRYFPVSRLSECLSSVKKVGWEGIVRFVSSEEQYKLGFNKNMFVWRPLWCIFVDFKLQRVDIDVSQMKGHEDKTFYQLQKEDTKGALVVHDWVFDQQNSFEKRDITNGCICECRWNPTGKTVVPPHGKEKAIQEFKGGWEIYRVRRDRVTPNPAWIVLKLVGEIERNMSEHVLLQGFGQTKRNRDRKKKKKKAQRK